jgi:hypothetical protein
VSLSLLSRKYSELNKAYPFPFQWGRMIPLTKNLGKEEVVEEKDDL